MVIPVLLNEQTLLSTVGERGDDRQLCFFPMEWGLVYVMEEAGLRYNWSCTNMPCDNMFIPKSTETVRPHQRCVILANGYFVKKLVEEERPYFAYFQDDMIYHPWEDEHSSVSGKNRNGSHLLPMAGAFSIWNSPEVGLVYTCAICTIKASGTIAQIHDRMPVILDDVEVARLWMDPNSNVHDTMRLSLKAVDKLRMYEVTPTVYNSNCNDIACIMPRELMNNESQEETGSCSTAEKQHSLEM